MAAAGKARREALCGHAIKMLRQALHRMTHAEAMAEDAGRQYPTEAYGKYPAMVGSLISACSVTRIELELALAQLEEK